MNVFIAPKTLDRETPEIMADIEAATDALQKIFLGEEVQTLYTVPFGEGQIRYLSNALHYLDLANAVYFCPGWEEDFSCQIIREICEATSIPRFEA